MAETAVVDGRYRMLDRLGRGGTRLAVDELLGRRVAIREVDPGAVDQPAVARLDHPGIIHVFDLIRWQDRWYMVTEFVPSGSLHDAAPVTHRVAARIGLGALAALQFAQAAGLRHGNLKPQNILLSDDGRVILTDFGGTAPDLPALGETLHLVTGPAPGPLTPVIEALRSGRSSDHVESLLRRVATGRAIGVSTPVPPAAFGILLQPRTRPAFRFRFRLRPARRRVPHPPHRIARSTRITVAAAAALLVGTTGAALALDAVSPPPAPPAPTARAAPICAERATSGTAVGTERVDHRYALPDGWRWHRDPTGFVVAVPPGWTRESDGAAACFRDPDGNRFFAVEADAPVSGPPLAHWRTVEQAALADGSLADRSLPGYRRLGLTTTDLKRGGAGWEFTWQPAAGVRRHERRLLLSMGDDRSYVVAWTTRDQDWVTSEPLLQLIVASLS